MREDADGSAFRADDVLRRLATTCASSRATCPQPLARVYREDWLQRYAWIAEQAGHGLALQRGLDAGHKYARSDRRSHLRWRLSPEVLEQIFCWSTIHERMSDLYEDGIRRIVLVDLGREYLRVPARVPSWAGLDVLAIGDSRFCAPGRSYRGLAVLPIGEALSLDAQAYVVSNTSYVHAHRRWLALSRSLSLPVYNWFDPPRAASHVATSPALSST